MKPSLLLAPICLVLGHKMDPAHGLFGRWGHDVCSRCGWTSTNGRRSRQSR